MICSAHRSSNGDPCRGRAIKGSNVCRVHGGSAPQVKAKAQQRLLQAADLLAGALVEIARNKKTPASVRVAAVIAVLDRAGLSVKQLVEHTGRDGGAIEVEIVQRLQAARERLQKLDGSSEHSP